MANETYYDGDLLIMSVWNSLATVPAWEPLGCLTSNGLNQSWSIDELPRNKCNPGVQLFKKGAKTTEMPFELVMIDETVDEGRASFAVLDELANGDDPVEWRLDAGTDIAGFEARFGSGVFSSLELDATAGENITVSGNIRVLSETSVDPHV